MTADNTPLVSDAQRELLIDIASENKPVLREKTGTAWKDLIYLQQAGLIYESPRTGMSDCGYFFLTSEGKSAISLAH